MPWEKNSQSASEAPVKIARDVEAKFPFNFNMSSS